MMPKVRIFKRAARDFESFATARKTTVQHVETVEEARRICAEWNARRTPAQVTQGLKYEFTADAEYGD